MLCVRHILCLIISPVLIAQDSDLSDAARQLLLQPRQGQAELTLSDGRKKSGSILRVLSQSVVFSPNSKSLACEDLALSEIAGINWPTYPHKNRAAEFAGTAFVGAVLNPFFWHTALLPHFDRSRRPCIRSPENGNRISRHGAASRANSCSRGQPFVIQKLRCAADDITSKASGSNWPWTEHLRK